MPLQMAPPSPPTTTTTKPTSPNSLPSIHSSNPTTLALALPSSPTTTIHARIHNTGLTSLIFLTSSTSDTPSGLSALGSFVYALPNTRKPSEPLCTPLYGQPQTVDFATRVAKVMAKRTGRPAYVGWSGSVGGVGAEAEEEMEGLRVVIEGVMKVLGGDRGKD